jgi:hypothetical protein
MQSEALPQKRIRPVAKSFEFSIVARGSARLTMPELAAIRKESLAGVPTPLSPQLLRHSDEQTLAALMALSEATKCSAMANSDFGNWAIVSSSRNLGRSAFATVIDKYRSEGPWGVSVQVIPHCTAHAVAGTISLALASHGPCIGAGTDSGGEFDALISVASILRRPNWCGAWVIFTGWSPELAIDPSGRPTSDSICSATAIAVTRRPSASVLGRIRIKVQPQLAGTLIDASSSDSLTAFLAGASGGSHSWTSAASGGIRVQVDFSPATTRGNLGPPSVRELGHNSLPHLELDSFPGRVAVSEQETN